MKHFSLITTTILFVAVAMLSEASAQITDLTFSRSATSESGVSEISFGFNLPAEVEVAIDQLGVAAALFQNNESFGQDLGIVVGGPVTSIGEVTVGQMLVGGMDLGSTSLDVTDFIAPGEDFYLGFSDGTDVGYFNIAWDSGTNGDIVYSGGRFASGGSSLTVAAVPEPGSVVLVSALALAGLVRRRRLA